MSTTRYDVAISFAREDRSIAREIAESLRNEGISVFFDEHASAELWGENLYEYLQKIYEDSKLCVVLISKNYTKNSWTHSELRNLIAHAARRPSFSILPIRLSDEPAPKELASFSYIKWNTISSKQLAMMVKDRLASISPKEPQRRGDDYRYHVIRRESGWSVKRSGASRAASIHLTRDEAIKAARKHARRHKPSVVVVHSEDGSIDSQETV